MGKTPQGLIRQFSDEELRADLEAGLKPPQIAQKYGVSRQAVYKRVNQLQLTTTAAAVAPQESRRFVGAQLDAMTQLLHSLGRVNLLMDACDEWLRDAERPEKYDIGARSDEVMVTYLTYSDNGNPVKKKARLSQLLLKIERELHGVHEIDRAESRHADPRELILKTAQEARQTVGAAAELARMLADMRAMEVFREALLTEIAKVSPDVAERIAEAVRRSIVFHAAFAGPGAPPPELPGGPG
jgi:hypothetical protein